MRHERNEEIVVSIVYISPTKHCYQFTAKSIQKHSLLLNLCGHVQIVDESLSSTRFKDRLC